MTIDLTQLNRTILEADIARATALQADMDTVEAGQELPLVDPVFTPAGINEDAAIDDSAGTLTQADGATMVLTGTATGRFKGNQLGSITGISVASSLSGDGGTSPVAQIHMAKVGHATRVFDLPIAIASGVPANALTLDGTPLTLNSEVLTFTGA